MIRAENLRHIYKSSSGDKVALDGVSFSITEGEFVAIIGTNGSGKSTLAKHFNALLLPTDGKIFIDGLDTSDEKNLWRVRENVGMVFQNPDSEIVAAIVEDDVAFGLENLGVAPEKIRERVDLALDAVNMTDYKKFAPSKLSGGQKQRIAIAGVIAMRTKIIVFDEPTAMLDPQGRREILEMVKRLHAQGKTIIYITHFMEEAAAAQRVFVMERGKIIRDDTPREIFTDVKEMKRLGFDVPVATELAARLRRKGFKLPQKILTADELATAIKHEKLGIKTDINQKDFPLSLINSPSLNVKGVSYTYMTGTPFEKTALKNISFGEAEGEVLAIAGHTGSGKSTLIQLVAGLIKLTSGEIEIDGLNVADKKIRRLVGIVFQYPEHQLFEETVEKDISFGPRNFGLSDKEISSRVDEAMQQVGLSAELKSSSPFELSGGQRRRVAIAGILALKPKYLILDEPTAGLDPLTKKNLLKEIFGTVKKSGVTIILVSHSMEDIAHFADRVVVLAQGEVLFMGAPRELFAQEKILLRAGLEPPPITKLLHTLGFIENALTLDEAEKIILARRADGK